MRDTPVHTESVNDWQHAHTFDQDIAKPGERRTLIVLSLTTTMMVVEIAAGVAFGSMALLADGLHMASHTAALGITAMAYIYARRHARDARFSFGTGKVNALAGFASAILLAAVALLMAWESVERFVNPVAIAFNQAIAVAVLGLLVNGVSVLMLGVRHAHDDHNLLAAYLHVLADALTSLLAIMALLAAKTLGWVWMDPLMGIVGATLVTRWSWSLLLRSGGVLLDREAPEDVRAAIRDTIEAADDNRVADLHVWSIGPGIYAAIIGIVTREPKPVEHYKCMLPGSLNLVHATVEVHRCTQ